MERSIISFCVSAFLVLITTPLVKKLAWGIGIVDIPKDNRRVHTKPMPLMGGLSLYIGAVISSLLFLPLSKSLISIIIGSTIIVFSGIIDDAKGISPKLKIIFQLMAALVLVFGDIKINFITNPFADGNLLLNLRWISIPITLFWVIGITNTLNLIDGLDGLAVGVAMISSISLVLVARKLGNPEVVILSAIMSGACLGFLPYNFNPARIFMGDTGSLFLGFMLAAISIEGVMKSVATISIMVPIFILALPIFDTTFAICRRILNRKPITAGDKSHLHHRLIGTGYSQRDTVLILYSISIIFGNFSVLVVDAHSSRIVLVSMTLVIVAIIIALRWGMFNDDFK